MDELSNGNFFQARGFPSSGNGIPMVSLQLANTTGRYLGLLFVEDVKKIISALEQAVNDASKQADLTEAGHE